MDRVTQMTAANAQEGAAARTQLLNQAHSLTEISQELHRLVDADAAATRA